MENPILLKNLSKKNKILLCVAGIILIAVALLIVSPDVNDENNNQQVVITNNNTGNTNADNTNTTVVDNDVINTNTNDSGQTNTSNANVNQAVVQDDSNTNQTPVNTNTNSNPIVVTNTQQAEIITATTINDTAIQLVSKQTGYCEALAPADWSFVTNTESTGADLFSPDQSQHAGWGISAVYTYMYPDVESFLNAWLSYAFTGSFTSSGFTLGIGREIYEGFIQHDFTTSTGRQGVAIYKTYNFGDPTMYVVSVYMADSISDQWSTKGATPFSVALSIRCVSQLRPTTSSVDLSSSNPSSSSDNPELSLSDKWTEAIMGYENVYSPTTGEHYEAPLTSKWDTGPEGSGYYRSLPGGGYEMLERGFGNY
ncbi:MAG: hypothetical protein Q8P20_08585 [bacterium]|nr:hypothetical protein [bacterium]